MTGNRHKIEAIQPFFDHFYVDFQSQNQEYLTNDFKLFNSGTHYQYYTTWHIGIWFQLVVAFNSVVVAYFLFQA